MSMLERVSRSKSFGGWTEVYEHRSKVCECTMRFSIYLPPQAEEGPLPVLYWLSGLTCTEENFITKAGVQAHAAKHGLIVVAPDTSPRGAGIRGEDEDYDLGTGAGFYVDATEPPWSAHYRMFSYVTEELPQLVEATFPVATGLRSVSGHSMGGHGALICSLKTPGFYTSVSAFAPICAPTKCSWGEKAFSNYLGYDRQAWEDYDATSLLGKVGGIPPTLIDQGLEDSFLQDQLHPHLFEGACNRYGFSPTIRRHDGYDHSYYFIATFMEEHVAFHAHALKAARAAEDETT